MTSRLKPDETIVLLPVVAIRTTEGWRARVHAWVFEPERQSAARRALRASLRTSLGLLDEDGDGEVFDRRAQAFLVDNERAKRLVVEIAGARYTLAPTDADGHSRTTVTLPADACATAPVTVRAVLGDGDARQFSGTIYPMWPGGLSVISDIDDTIKITNVRDRREVLRNTFLREFHAVPGMAATYTRWAAAGVRFHYVSASPWHLYPDLAALVAEQGFPPGSVHLKSFRWKDETFLSLLEDPMRYKVPLILDVLAGCAPRGFVLVGDSGEKDPEIYGQVFRSVPNRIQHIYIRDVTDEPRTAARYAQAFAGVPTGRWTVFTDPESLPATL